MAKMRSLKLREVLWKISKSQTRGLGLGCRASLVVMLPVLVLLWVPHFRDGTIRTKRADNHDL